MRLLFCWALLLCSLSLGLIAQSTSPDTVEYQSNPVLLQATRLSTSQQDATLAVTVLNQDQLQRGQQQLSLNESLDFVPGLYALNSQNFSQDLRVAIRGFGARSAFGIRGIRVMVDGLPESTPDGQAQVDNIDLGILHRAEVIRGPSSGLYGNAAGGVISLQTNPIPEDFELNSRLSFGSNGFQRYQVGIGNRDSTWGYSIYGSHTRFEGYRQNSAVENSFFNAKLAYLADTNSTITFLLNYFNSPRSEDPGGINLQDAQADRTQAREANVNFQSGERVQQGRMGLIWDKNLGRQHQIQAKTYVLFRDFQNALPFGNGGIVDLDRVYAGLGLNYSFQGTLGENLYRLKAGIDIDQQTDDRLRFNNEAGDLGDKTFDQEERFTSTGAYILQDLVADRWRFHLGTRFDAVRLRAQDRFVSNGNQSGEIDYNRFNPMGGISFQVNRRLSTYLQVSTSFETPTLSELSANPTGEGGFNGDLSPQRTVNYEWGLRGVLFPKFYFDIAAFYIDIENELVPFELEDFPGRTFFRNAGVSERLGVELSMNYRLSEALSFMATYTRSEFTYQSYQTPDDIFDGNRLPALPQHMGLLGVNLDLPNGFFAKSWLRWNSDVFADDANETQVDGYAILNARIGYEQDLGTWTLSPFFGVNNLLGTEYFDNIRINAFGRRYYEPAPVATVFGGLSLLIK